MPVEPTPTTAPHSASTSRRGPMAVKRGNSVNEDMRAAVGIIKRDMGTPSQVEMKQLERG